MPTGQATEGCRHNRSRRGNAAAIATAAPPSLLPPLSELVESRAANRVISFHMPVAARSLGVIAQKAIAQSLKTVGTNWIAGVLTNFSLEMTLTMLEGPIQASLLTSRRCFGRRFAERFKGEDQQSAWSGIEGVGQNISSKELCGRNRLGLKIGTRSLPQRIEEFAKPKSTVLECDGERRLVKENYNLVKWAQEVF